MAACYSKKNKTRERQKNVRTEDLGSRKTSSLLQDFGLFSRYYYSERLLTACQRSEMREHRRNLWLRPESLFSYNSSSHTEIAKILSWCKFSHSSSIFFYILVQKLCKYSCYVKKRERRTVAESVAKQFNYYHGNIYILATVYWFQDDMQRLYVMLQTRGNQAILAPLNFLHNLVFKKHKAISIKIGLDSLTALRWLIHQLKKRQFIF